jgi:HSP20 family protein
MRFQPNNKENAKMRDLIPWGRSRTPQRYGEQRWEDGSPFLTLRREMDRLFDEAFRGFGFGGEFALSRGGLGLGWPHVEIADRDKEIRVTAELPGLEEKDVEIQVDDDVLTIRGEKRTEADDEDRRYSERSYGRFEAPSASRSRTEKKES